ncbi:MAG TPA: hypothetical protein VGP82_01970 [Ktedonobacterales bacterium]|nr:hypothetical protein [Ktedonobacterales bacterium]
MIRLKQIRPHGVPSPVGISSENAAQRIAAEWEEQGELREGVYIPRRDTSSWSNVRAGGRIFPASHHHARFYVTESDDDFHVELDGDDVSTHVLLEAQRAADLPMTSLFGILQEASGFFERGSVGYSPASRSGTYDGIASCAARSGGSSRWR